MVNMDLFQKILDKATSLREAIDAYKELTQQAPVSEKATRSKHVKRIGRTRSAVRQMLTEMGAKPRDIPPKQRAALAKGRPARINESVLRVIS